MLTLRKFYLRLASWYDDQRLQDSRTYKLLAIHMKDPPEPGVLFPSLRTVHAEDSDMDDSSVFQAVAASLSQYNR